MSVMARFKANRLVAQDECLALAQVLRRTIFSSRPVRSGATISNPGCE
jgi:hypothetical protein